MIALIPAKGQSERIPRKNMALLGGHPLIDWTIAPAIASGVFDEIWVSSEDEEILEHARLKGVKGLRRPPHLAAPDVTVADVVTHVRQWLEYRGPLAVLVPTSPFRRPETIRAVVTMAQDDPDWDILSVRPADHPWATLEFSENVAGVWPREGIYRWRAPRSERPEALIADGAYWILQGVKGWSAKPFSAPPDERLDINTPEDLAYAEWRVQTGRIPCQTIATGR